MALIIFCFCVFYSIHHFCRFVLFCAAYVFCSRALLTTSHLFFFGFGKWGAGTQSCLKGWNSVTVALFFSLGGSICLSSSCLLGGLLFLYLFFSDVWNRDFFLL